MNLRLLLKIFAPQKIADYRLPSQLLTSFVFTYIHKFVMRGALTLRGTPYPLLVPCNRRKQLGKKYLAWLS